MKLADMKFTLLFPLIICLIIGAYTGTKKVVTGFRESGWGDKISDVRAREIANKVDSLKMNGFTLLVYKDKVADRNAYIYYGFRDDRLRFGAYTFLDDHTDSLQNYFSDYEKVKNLIAKEYGTPASDYWVTSKNKTGLYKENKKLAETALQLGLLELRTRWDSNTGSIILSLKQEKGVYIKVRYLSNDFLNHFDPSEITLLERTAK